MDIKAEATKVRQVRGLINAAKEIYLWVCYGEKEEDGIPIDLMCPVHVQRPTAKQICDYADENDDETIVVNTFKSGKVLYIGDVDMNDEEPAEDDEAEIEEEEEEEDA